MLTYDIITDREEALARWLCIKYGGEPDDIIHTSYRFVEKKEPWGPWGILYKKVMVKEPAGDVIPRWRLYINDARKFIFCTEFLEATKRKRKTRSK